MDIAALILSIIALLTSNACLVLLLAKRFSTHKVEYAYAPQQETVIDWEAPPDLRYADGETTLTPGPRTTMTMAEDERRRRLDREEAALNNLAESDFGDF